MSMTIFKLQPGSTVTLRLHGAAPTGYALEEAVFLGLKGEGKNTKARFLTTPNTSSPYEWEAYRYRGGWAYGSDAYRLQLVTVEELPKPAQVVLETPEPNNRQGVPLVLWQMKAYLANREEQQDTTTKRFTQPAADLIKDWIAELEKNS